MTSRIAIGRILGPHGVRGVVRIGFHDPSRREYAPGSRLRLLRDGGREETVTLEWMRPHQNNYLAALRGCRDREHAKRLRGAEIVIDREQLPEPEDGSWYWVDLIGLTVVTGDGESLGRITAILPTGSNDVYVVRDGERETLVPALASVVREVDVAGGVMRVDLPQGL